MNVSLRRPISVRSTAQLDVLPHGSRPIPVGLERRKYSRLRHKQVLCERSKAARCTTPVLSARWASDLRVEAQFRPKEDE